MKVNLSMRAANLLHAMILDPMSQWGREDLYKPDEVGRRELGALARFVENKLTSPPLPANAEAGRAYFDDLAKAYEGGDEKAITAAWTRAGNLYRKFRPGVYNLRPCSVERLKAMARHYGEKKSKAYLDLHFADLEGALHFEPFADACEDDEGESDGDETKELPAVAAE